MLLLLLLFWPGVLFDTSELERQCSEFVALFNTTEPILAQHLLHHVGSDLATLVPNILFCDGASTTGTDGTKKLRVVLGIDGRFELLTAALRRAEAETELIEAFSLHLSLMYVEIYARADKESERDMGRGDPRGRPPIFRFWAS